MRHALLCLLQVQEKGKFLKGLAVVDDVAYFGISVWMDRSVRDDPANDGEVAAVDLLSGMLLWRRQVRISDKNWFVFAVAAAGED